MSARRLILVVFAGSGAAALIYEISWTRLLALYLGHTVPAASTVLAAFMAGLAGGALAGGAIARRRTPSGALRLYAALEVLVAALAIVLPGLLRLGQPLLAATYHEGHGGLPFVLARLAISLLAVFLPTLAMGATYPLAIRALPHDQPARGLGPSNGATQLYTANTIGAAIGALAAGFVLLPALGLRGTTAIGVVLNLAAAAGALAATRNVDRAATARLAATPPRTITATTPPRRKRKPGSAAAVLGRAAVAVRDAPQPGLALALTALAGFAALALEVVWTRTLALIIGPTTYAFTAMLAAFIAGMAAGSATGTALARRFGAARPLALALSLAGAGTLGAEWLAAEWLPHQNAAAIIAGSGGFGWLMFRQALVTIAVLFPMSAGFGAAFPLSLVLAGAGPDTEEAPAAARVYVANTLAAIVGSMVGGYLLIPKLGLQASLRGLGAGVAIAGLLALAGGARPRRAGDALALAAATAVVLAAWWLPPWSPAFLSSGAYKYALYARGDLDTMLTAGQLLDYREGAAGTVSVRQLNGVRSLAIDGKVDASTGADMLTQKLLAHLPLLMHPQPRRVAIIGLGSGVTLGAALTHPIEAADVVELSPEVAAASRLFADTNGRALDDPRARLIQGDGRTHLQLSRQQYDVIVSEPSNPWMAGVATLFTREFFEAARARLAPGGLLCQWSHTYDISEADLRSIVATFAEAFPHGSLWLVGEGDLLMIGSTGGAEPSVAQLAAYWLRPGVGPDLARVGAVTPFTVLSLYLGGPAAIRLLADGAAIQRDDRTALEFTGPRAIYDRLGTNLAPRLRQIASQASRPAAVSAALAAASSGDWRDRGLMLARADAHGLAWDDLLRAVSVDPNDRAALVGLSQAAADARRQSDTVTALRQLADAHPGSAAIRVALSRLLASEGAVEPALALAREAMRIAPDEAAGLAQLASIYADLGDPRQLGPVVAELRQRFPTDPETRYLDASFRFMSGRYVEAATLAREVVIERPTDARAWNLLGATHATLGEIEPARAAFERALAADPRDSNTYTNLGRLEVQASRPAEAAARFAEALSLDPGNEAAIAGLQQARRPNR